MKASEFEKDTQYFRFCAYGFLKNLKFYEPFIMLFLLEQLAGNFSQVGILYALRFIIRTLLEIPSGIIADALGRKGSLVFSYACYILSFISYFLANSFILLLIPTVLFGVADAFRTGTHKAMIVDYLNLKGWNAHKTSYYGYTRSWSQTGSAISSLATLIIFFLVPEYRIIFLLSGIPYVLGTINLLSYPAYLNKCDTNSKESSLLKIKDKFRDCLYMLSSRATIKKLVGTSTFFGYHHALKDYLQPVALSISFALPVLISDKVDNAMVFLVPAIYFVIYLLTTAASRNSGKAQQLFTSTHRSIKLLSITGGVLGIAMGLFYYFQQPLISLFFFAAVFVCINLQRPAVVSYISSGFNQKSMATVLSIESQLGSLLAAIFALVGGVIADIYGLAATLIIISIVLILLTSLIWFNGNENNHLPNSE
jgi:MFS family permease